MGVSFVLLGFVLLPLQYGDPCQEHLSQESETKSFPLSTLSTMECFLTQTVHVFCLFVCLST